MMLLTLKTLHTLTVLVLWLSYTAFALDPARLIQMQRDLASKENDIRKLLSKPKWNLSANIKELSLTKQTPKVNWTEYLSPLIVDGERPNATSCSLADKQLQLLWFESNNSFYFLSVAESTVKLIRGDCSQVSEFKDVQISHLCCDRGYCSSGSIILVGQSNHKTNFYSLREDENLTKLHQVSPIRNSSEIVLAFARHTASRQNQYYVVERTGKVTVYDETFTPRLTVDLGNEVTTAIDHHPHPLVLINSEDIYVFDTTKYSISLSDCPYLGKMMKIATDSAYSSQVAALSSNRLYEIQIGGSFKGCRKMTERIIPASVIASNSQISKDSVELYGKYFNLTASTLLQQSMCLSGFKKYTMTLRGRRQNPYKFTHCCSDYGCHLWVPSPSDFHQQGSSTIGWIVGVFIMLLFACFKMMSSKPLRELDTDQEEQQLPPSASELSPHEIANLIKSHGD